MMTFHNYKLSFPKEKKNVFTNHPTQLRLFEEKDVRRFDVAVEDLQVPCVAPCSFFRNMGRGEYVT
jgi:hypothetical protein